MAQSKSFAVLWREHPPGANTDFEDQLFWHCLTWHSLPVAKILIRWRPEFFREDFGFLHEVGFARTTGEVVGDLNRCYGRNVRDRKPCFDLAQLVLIRFHGWLT